MARLIHQIGITLSSDAADIRAAFQRGLDEPSLQVVTDTFSDFVVGSLSLPADGRVVSLSLGNLQDARGYYLELYGGGALLALNPASIPASLSAGDAGVMQLRPVGTDASGQFLPLHSYQDASVQSIYLSSPDAVVLTGAYAAWGFAQAPA